MIKLSFVAQNRDIIHLSVEGKIIKYYDKIWKNGVQFMPKDPQFVLKLLKARNTIPFSNQIISWINESNTGKNLEEYNNCKTEEELAEMVKRDAKIKGLLEVKNDNK
jgi:hypothetical protein